MNQPHQYNLGQVGNCAYAALVDTEASIKWLCWPRFDSSFIFGSLLDNEKGGNFAVTPYSKKYTTVQQYIDNTNLLNTRFECEDGVFEVIDFAPRFHLYERFHKPLMFFRKIKKISGKPRVSIKCNPTGDYGKISPSVLKGSNHIRYDGLEEPLRLTTNASLTYILNEKDFVLNTDIYLVLSWGLAFEGPLISTFEDFYDRTKNYWRTWVERCTLPKVFQKEVIRSALTLKMHQYEDTGGIIASCTTSLPEIHNEGRNWDYRFCWIRDTYYTLSALHSLGHFEEMEKYAFFIENLNLENLSGLQPVYRIDGSAEMTEIELPLKGYLGNQPVRIGNQAASQIQHDAYGQVCLALFSLYTDERLLERVDRSSTQVMRTLLKYIEKTMDEPDNGVWEFRGKQAVHSYTLLFHWAGSAAVLKVANQVGDQELAKNAEHCMLAAQERLESCYLKDKKVYAQAVGSRDLDASALQIITLGYLYNKDKNLSIDHLRVIEAELQLSPGFFLRYKHKDDFGHQKSAFLVCSFWHIEALATLGFAQEALELLHIVKKAQNHVGLMSEDYDVDTQSQWGNFPQTYSHVGMINCAFAIDKALNKPAFL